MKIDTSHRRFRPQWWATRSLATAGIIASIFTVRDVHASPAAFTFTPPNPGWVVALNNGAPLTDLEGDSPGPRDIVGDAANPVLFIASDAEHIYFRLRVNAYPLQSPTNFTSYGWGCLINTDSNLTTFEYSTIVDGIGSTDRIYFYQNTVTTTPNNPLETPDMPPIVATANPLTTAVGHAQVTVASSNFGGDPDYFISWAEDLAPLLAAGFNPATPASYFCGSANGSNILGADCTGGPNCLSLNTQFTDPVGCGEQGCAVCGNGKKDMGEGCDDGNTINNDGCNSQCLLELGQPCAGVDPACASGYCDPAGNICVCDADGDCPAGQICNTMADPNQCVNAGCGNAILEAGEGCDDGNLMAGDGCSIDCKKELGQPCIDGTECGSQNCDGTTKTCECDENTDCSMGQICNTDINPPVCETTGGCTDDSQCTSGVCDEISFTCVACLVDSDCPNEGTCTAARTCEPIGFIVEGGGLLCSSCTMSSNDNNMPLAVLGLFALAMTRRRRR
ncbi:MAG TPA: hypothetical protein PK156_29055 [Polyangium sp.]|nr:hypothetical protein [Polyangium sp.]